MDGAQAYYRYVGDAQWSVRVSRRTICTEAFARARVERMVMRILVIVGCDYSENE